MPFTGLKFPKFTARAVGAISAASLTAYLLYFPANGSLKARSGRLNRQEKSVSTNAISEATAANLLDSITSLVENYYVDADRVTGDQLVSGAMRSLAYAIPDLKFQDSDRTYSISSRTETIEFNKTGEIAYDELLGRLKSLIAFCDRISIKDFMEHGESIMLGAEKDSTAVVLNALLSSLDAHSSLLSSDAYQELRQGTEGSFGGLGVLVGVRDHVLTVLKPLPKSPALRMGIRKNDKIISIDGFNTFGLSLDKLVPHMRGDPGSSAQLVTLRPGAWSTRQFSLTREVIEVDSVEAFEHHHGDVHILRLAVENFAARTSKEIVDHLRKFRRKYPISGLVLDLRGNPGGLLDQAVMVSDIFLEGGIVVSTKGRREEIERASRTYEESDFPLVVLMNEDSASASEIVAGALQDNGRALVIGQPSFGKGSVQTVFELPEQRALKLTIARYFTPAAKSIQNIGIMPDVWIQPVVKSNENLNLFGVYRYRNERFLPNHLSAASAGPVKRSWPSEKGYYLVAPGVTQEGSKRQDFEMELAMTIFEKVRGAYGNGLPASAHRASHWLALSSGSIRERLEKMTRETTAWFFASHGVRWSQEIQKTVDSSSLTLQVKVPNEGLRGSVGGILDVPWKVTNSGSQTAENVSVFVQSAVSGIETREVLVGPISPGRAKEGHVKVQIPNAMTPGLHYINAGIAVDAQALPNAQGEFLVSIEDEKSSQLEVNLSFEDGNDDLEKNVLELNEKAVVRIMIENNSELDSGDARLVVSNLAGGQVKIKVPETHLGVIKTSGKREVRIPIEASAPIESSMISLGFAIYQGGNSGASFKTLDVLTSGPLTAASELKALSH
jgi:carboxyl-terminal processing protease